jgi:hypothetical protein
MIYNAGALNHIGSAEDPLFCVERVAERVQGDGCALSLG